MVSDHHKQALRQAQVSAGHNVHGHTYMIKPVLVFCCNVCRLCMIVIFAALACCQLLCIHS